MRYAPVACALLAAACATRRPPAPRCDGEPSANVLQRRCDDGTASCRHRLAGMYRDGQGVAADATKANALWRLGCDGGHAPSCKSLAPSRMLSRGTEKNEAQGAELFRKACTLGDQKGCTYFAES